MEFHPIFWIYSLIQWVLDKFLSPTPPLPKASLGRPRIAVIGAGLTGVSSASHCVGHGFDVTIFEAGNEKSIGGIWSVRFLPSPSNDTNMVLTHRYRKSTTHQACRSIASCTVSIRQSSGPPATPTGNKSSPRSLNCGKDTDYKSGPNSIPGCIQQGRILMDDGSSTMTPRLATLMVSLLL